MFHQLVLDPADIRLHPIPRFRRLLAEGDDVLFQTVEPVRNGGQVLFELRETRGERLEVWIGARSDLVAQGLNLLFGASGPPARGRDSVAATATWFRGILSIRWRRVAGSVPIPSGAI
jgi:hypothetical protein